MDGLACTPTLPASMSVQIMPGSLTQLSVGRCNAYGSLAADTTIPSSKMGINIAPQYFIQSPVNSGYSVNYLIEACLQESTESVVLPY